MKKILATSTLALAIMLSTTGCAPKGISSAQIGQRMTVEAGVVTSVQIVSLNTEGVGNTLGGIVGAVAGGAAGNQVGGGTGQAVATVAGTVLGGVLGGMAGDAMDTNYGQQVSVKLNNGQTVGTVLRINGSTPQLAIGQAVNVYMSGGSISNITGR